MKSKILALVIVTVAFSGFSVAQTFDDFEFEPGPDFSHEVTGGESFVQEANFSSDAERVVPVGLEVGVEASEHGLSDSGQEFGVSGSIFSEDVDMLDFVEELWDRGVIHGLEDGDTFIFIREADFKYGIDESDVVYSNETDFDQLDPVFEEESFDDRAGAVFEEDAFTDVESDDEYLAFFIDDEQEFIDSSKNQLPNYMAVPLEASVRSKFSTEFDNGVYSSVFGPPHYGFVPSGDSGVEWDLEADPAVKPDSFSFEFDIRSIPGVVEDSVREEVVDGEASVETEATEVDLEASEDGEVSVEEYSDVSVDNSDREFVNGVGVEAPDNASGTVSFSYSQSFVDENDLDEGSMDVRFLNESTGEWTTEGVEKVDVHTAENVVEASVKHFSTYAVFAEEDESTSSPSSSSGPVAISTEEESENESVNDSEQEETADDDVEEEDTDGNVSDSGESDGSSQESDGADQDSDDSEASDEEQDETDSGTEDNSSDVSQTQGMTGLFSADSPAPVAVIVLVLSALFTYRYRSKLAGYVD